MDTVDILELATGIDTSHRPTQKLALASCYLLMMFANCTIITLIQTGLNLRGAPIWYISHTPKIYRECTASSAKPKRRHCFGTKQQVPRMRQAVHLRVAVSVSVAVQSPWAHNITTSTWVISSFVPSCCVARHMLWRFNLLTSTTQKSRWSWNGNKPRIQSWSNCWRCLGEVFCFFFPGKMVLLDGKRSESWLNSKVVDVGNK